MRTHKKAAAQAVHYIHKKITLVSFFKNTFIVIAVLTALLGAAQAQSHFSKPVIVLKGRVTAEQTGDAQSVKISIRSAEDNMAEVTSSQSNSLSGNYLVVLKPSTKYWVYLENPGVVSTKKELIETPPVKKHTIQIDKDFTVSKLSDKDLSEESLTGGSRKSYVLQKPITR
jgi:hypothetical protein